MRSDSPWPIPLGSTTFAGVKHLVRKLSVAALLVLLTGSLWLNWRQAVQLRERERQAVDGLHETMSSIALHMHNALALGADPPVGTVTGSISSCWQAHERLVATGAFSSSLPAREKPLHEALWGFFMHLAETCSALSSLDSQDEMVHAQAERAVAYISRDIYQATNWPTYVHTQAEREQMVQAMAEYRRQDRGGDEAGAD
jgi:hypothetical protein